MAYIFLHHKPNFKATASIHPLQSTGTKKKCRTGGAIGIFALFNHTLMRPSHNKHML